MSEMVERVGSLLMSKFPGVDADFDAIASEVIEAMSVPTDAMILAGARYHDDNWRVSHAREDTNAEAIWQDMIDTALKG